MRDFLLTCTRSITSNNSVYAITNGAATYRRCALGATARRRWRTGVSEMVFSRNLCTIFRHANRMEMVYKLARISMMENAILMLSVPTKNSIPMYKNKIWAVVDPSVKFAWSVNNAQNASSVQTYSKPKKTIVSIWKE